MPGSPWSAPFSMSIGRYYPTLISLDRRGPFSSNCSPFSVPRACQAVLGGPPTVSNEGNELWQLFHPTLADPGLHTLVAPPMPNAHSPTGSTEEYKTPSATPVEPLLDSYPRAFQLGEIDPQNPSILGQIFVAFDVDSAGNPPNAPGSAWVMMPPPATVNTSGCWELWPAKNSLSSPLQDVHDRYYAPAVLLHQLQQKNRILLFGGSQSTLTEPGVVIKRVQEYEPGSDPKSGSWRDKADLNFARVFNNAVILPTGQILVLGGSSVDTHHGGTFAPGIWVLTPELYEPGPLPTSTGSTTNMAAHQAPRLYHSVAVLLLDGSVLLAGGHERPNWGAPPSGRTGEVFSPPYFFNGNRPHINSAPGTITFAPTGSVFDIAVTTFHDHVHSVVLLRPAAVTHHSDYDQRYIELEFNVESVVDGVATLNVTPPHESLGPPGYYTLWVVESKTSGTPTYQDLIPSIAKVVSLQ